MEMSFLRKYMFSYLNNEINMEFIHDIDGLVQDCSNSIVNTLSRVAAVLH